MTTLSPDDAASLAQLAGAAARDLSIGAALPPGWSVFETFPNAPPPLGPDTTGAQGFIASGALPSDPGTQVTVIALAYPLQSYAAWSSATVIGRPAGLLPLPAGVSDVNANAIAPAVAGYAALRDELWQAFARTAPRDVIVTGTQLGAAMAAIGAIDLRPGQIGPDGTTKGPAAKSRCVMLSAPAPGDQALAQLLAAQTQAAWTLSTAHLGVSIDTFPGAPTDGAVVAGTPMAIPARTLAAPGLISDADTWVQRDSDAYVAALGGDPVDLGTVAAQMATQAAFDVLRAATLADLIGLPYLLSGYPGLRIAAPMVPYALSAPIANGPTIWGVSARAPGTAALLFRDAVGWQEFDTLTCDYNPVATPFSGPEWTTAKIHSGAATLFGTLRAAIAAEAGAALKADAATVLDFAGHGLGGAVAALAAIDTIQTLNPSQTPRVWMFGAPVFGTYDFLTLAAKLVGPTTISLSRLTDFLPRIPFAFGNDGLGQPVSLLGRPRITDPDGHGLSGYASLLSPRRAPEVM
ncbi:lipase family protein [Paracoccus lutimaris]|uniref:Lipase (Class 3) n=1 Tax=Paracoccus lutimaris TaxID=1490030 RepID=A0A368YXW9_9RHOB|nr:hypothetical protein [Paracoccus lutimaris]RCW84096.1 lipase (class 3) [Paracoccus lutimaris]